MVCPRDSAGWRTDQFYSLLRLDQNRFSSGQQSLLLARPTETLTLAESSSPVGVVTKQVVGAKGTPFRLSTGTGHGS
jgi:hypothetical protein